MARLVNILFCISFPAILLIRSWDFLIFRSGSQLYFSNEPTALTFLAALVVYAALLGLTSSILYLYRRVDIRFIRLAIEIIFLLSFSVVARFLYDAVFPQGLGRLLLFAALLAPVIGVVGLYFLRSIARLAFLVVSVAFPFSLMMVGQAVVGVVGSTMSPALAATENVPADPAPRTAGQTRVIVLILDGLDVVTSFDERPVGWNFPNFDRLKDDSLFVTNAQAAGGFTLDAVPTMLTGRQVTEARVSPNAELMLRFEGSSSDERFSETENIFRWANEAGFRTGVAGVYHPYCALFGEILSSCMQVFAFNPPDTAVPTTFEQAVLFHLGGMSLIPDRVGAIAAHKIIADEALRLALDPNIDFAFLHMIPPHFPPIYDAEKGEFTTLNFRASGYLDGIALADLFVGELRSVLEGQQIWDSTNLIVTADHGGPPGPLGLIGTANYTTSRERVPLFIKLSGEPPNDVYDKPMNAMIFGELVGALLSNSISSYADLTEWLDQHR